jgi:hypothetical protein
MREYRKCAQEWVDFKLIRASGIVESESGRKAGATSELSNQNPYKYQGHPQKLMFSGRFMQVKEGKTGENNQSYRFLHNF